MIKIYHNPRCQKSRKALQILIESGKEFQVREYLKVLIIREELTSVISSLRLSPIDLLRKGERIYVSTFNILLNWKTFSTILQKRILNLIC